jgi:hypothetical protein
MGSGLAAPLRPGMTLLPDTEIAEDHVEQIFGAQLRQAGRARSPQTSSGLLQSLTMPGTRQNPGPRCDSSQQPAGQASISAPISTRERGSDAVRRRSLVTEAAADGVLGSPQVSTLTIS